MVELKKNTQNFTTTSFQVNHENKMHQKICVIAKTWMKLNLDYKTYWSVFSCPIQEK